MTKTKFYHVSSQTSKKNSFHETQGKVFYKVIQEVLRFKK